MSDINLTKAVRQNLLSLQNTAKLMATTQNRLATGNKVNTALDNPSNFFTASALTARAGELDALLDSMNNGIKTLEAADNGLTSITKTLESMQSTLRQARQDKTFETASYTLGTASNYPGDKLTFTGGAFGTSGGGGTVTLMTSSAQSATGGTYVPPAAPPVKASTTGQSALLADQTALNTTSISIAYGSGSVNVAFSGLTTTSGAAGVIAQINTAIAADPDMAGKVTATDDGSGKVVLTAATAENGKTIVVSGGAAPSVVGATPTTVAGNSGSTNFSVNGVAVSLTSADTTAAKAIATINVQLGNAGSKFKAVDDGTGKIKIQANDSTAGALKITGADAGQFGAAIDDTTLHFAKTTDQLVNEINNNSSLGAKIKASNDNGRLRLQNLSTQDLNVDGVSSSGTIDGSSAGAASIGGNTVRSGLADQFNVLRDQLDKLADDASFNGINLLRGDKLKITFNETGTSSIDIQVPGGKSVDTTQLGLPTTMQAKDLDSDTSIDGLLDNVKTALNQVRSQSSTFGSNLSVVENRQDFTKKMMNTLQTGGSNLTLADMNEEAANMVALQTRQSLATSSLSMANQADQNVLQLLRG